MMGRGAEGGISGISSSTSSLSAGQVHSSHKLNCHSRVMDIYSQAVKALAVKSPFGGDEAGNAGGPGSGFSGPLVKLPSSADPKRKNRARKTQAVSQKRNFGDLDAGNLKFWGQMEDYFREVTAEDMRLLFHRTSFRLLDSSHAQDSCFNIRPPGRRYLELWAEEDRKCGFVSPSLRRSAEQSSRGIKRKLLTANPVSKKKKTAVSSQGEVITTIVSPPEVEDEELCHVCNGGESEIVFCDSCNVGVHQDCYGIHSPPDGPWLCSWCSYGQSSDSEHGPYKCLLCPGKTGALKPVAADSDLASKKTRFAHLFCAQWVPETYIQDTVAMEPIRNIQGVKEERWRLVCVLCKEKHGACIQCSHGLCATPFHPLCARDAKLWMELSSREDTDDLEVRAYCQKHSATRPGKASLDSTESKDDLFQSKAMQVTVPKDENTEAIQNGRKPNISDQQPEFADRLITNLKKVTQHLGMSMETVASEADIPQHSLLLWLEGKLHEDESKINASICAWLCTYSSLLKCSLSGSESEQAIELKRNGYSEPAVKEMETRANHVDCTENMATGDVGQVKTNCQLLEAEDDFSFETEDRHNGSSVARNTNVSTNTLNVMQNGTRLLENVEAMRNAESMDSESPCPEPREHEEVIESAVFVAPEILRRLQSLKENAQLVPSSDSQHEKAVETESSQKSDVDDQWNQLRQAKHLGIMDWFPQDEVEAEIFVLQNQLIDCAQSNRCLSERLISRILCQLSKERQAARKQLHDVSMVSQFLADAKEARKQGRREKRDKEAQAVLAAATAAAAASPRTGYVKRDGGLQDDSFYPAQELNLGSPYVRPFRPPVPKPPRLNVSSSFRSQPKVSALKVQEEVVACDVCSSSDSVRTNRIIQCSRCNVAVHQECYGVLRLPAGLWYCQPCTEFQQQFQPVKFLEETEKITPGVECALCPNTCGAFKRSSDGRWVHVFCALWIPKSTFGREQTSPIGGLDAVPAERFNLICSICQHQQGACVKCNFGHCYGAFHPMCARDAGLYMSVRYMNGRTHYRAYCERHSPQQRAKSADFLSQAELKQFGTPDEINSLRQIRVEFERVRLICERICKRERIKRELTHCIKDVYITQLTAATGGHPVEQIANNHERSYDGNGALYSDALLDVPWTAESKLTSIGGESIWPVGRGSGVIVKEPTSKRSSLPEPDSVLQSKDQKKSKKYNRHSEPLGREKIMTPSEASMHNKLLPKGYAYVPVDMLEKGKQQEAHQQQQQQEEDQQQQQQQQQQQESQLQLQPDEKQSEQ